MLIWWQSLYEVARICDSQLYNRYAIAGGAGRATSITGSSVTYAGGGGGATGSGTGGGAAGSGGGGLGGSTTVPSGGAGVANTGGGSGGSRDTATSSLSGGSGIVVVRYLVA